MKEKYLIDPEIHFLNHGSFGVCPKPILEKYFDLMRQMEAQPVKFLYRDLQERLSEARKTLGCYVQAESEQLVFVNNGTFGINAIAKTIDLQSGDEILCTNHIYGSVENVLVHTFVSQGVQIRKAQIPLPYESQDQIFDIIRSAITPQTKLLMVDHISSPTAVHFPIKRLSQLAKECGIIFAVDGAHAPGQIPINLCDLSPDFYLGNCHKWMGAPKSVAFLYMSQKWLERCRPVVVSWGHGPNYENLTGNPMIDMYQWVGTNNPCATLCVPDVIRFMEENNWSAQQERCHALLQNAQQTLNRLSGYASIYPNASEYIQMADIELPVTDPQALKTYLYDQYKVEVPINRWDGRIFARVSVQCYNNQADLDALIAGICDYYQLQ